MTLNYDIDKKDLHSCHCADRVENESKKVTLTISLKRCPERLCYSEGLGATILLCHDIEMGPHLKSSGELVARQDKDLFKVFH